MPGMQYLISFALLVALLAWMVGVYNNLEHLRKGVCECWAQWRQHTHRRNVCLNDFARSLAPFMPAGDPLPQSLLRLSADSERSLSLVESPQWGAHHGFLGGAEHLLRMAVAQSVHVVEASPAMRSDAHLLQLSRSVSSALYQQEQLMELFNRSAREYNAALRHVSARVLASVFGFSAVNMLEMSSRQNTRST